MAGACTALAAALLIGVTLLTPLPAALLRTAGLAYLERQHGIAGTAGRLELDVARLRIAIEDLRLAVRDHPQEPFLRVGETRIDLSWSAIWNGLALEELVLRRAAVTVVRRSDGSSNLPAGRAAATTAPEGETAAGDDSGRQPARALPLGRVDVSGLTVDWRDEVAGFTAHLPPTAVNLSPRATRSGGTVAMDGTASASWRGRTTQFTRLAGEVDYDGATVGVRRLELSGPGLALTLDGRVETVPATLRLAVTLSLIHISEPT